MSEILNIEVESESIVGKLKISPNTTIADWAALEKIFTKCYAKSNKPSSPEIKTEAHIILKNSQLIQFGPRRLSYPDREAVGKIIDNLLARGIIRKSSSEYSSPIVLTRKKNGEIRMCVDFQALNKIMARDNYPLPLIEDQLERLKGKRYFSAMDLKDGFYHVAMAPESIKFTSFVTPMGQFEYLVMPFGLKIGPQCFQRFICEILAELLKSECVVVYMDDILVATENMAEHLKIIRSVLNTLIRNNLELHFDKCRFLCTDIVYLGYHVTAEGLSPTHSGIAAVRDFPEPQTTKAVQSFIGLAFYFRKFIKGFSVIATPLYQLLKKDVTFQFGDREKSAFETLKLKLINAPVLSIYSPHVYTELHCDASSLGFGATLLQRQTNKAMHPSSTLANVQQNPNLDITALNWRPLLLFTLYADLKFISRECHLLLCQTVVRLRKRLKNET